MCCDNLMYFALVRTDYKFCFFAESVLAYSANKNIDNSATLSTDEKSTDTCARSA